MDSGANHVKLIILQEKSIAKNVETIWEIDDFIINSINIIQKLILYQFKIIIFFINIIQLNRFL